MTIYISIFMSLVYASISITFQHNIHVHNTSLKAYHGMKTDGYQVSCTFAIEFYHMCYYKYI